MAPPPSVEFDASISIKIGAQVLNLPKKMWEEGSLDELRKVNPDLASKFEQELVAHKAVVDQIESHFRPIIKKHERAEARASREATNAHKRIIQFPVTTAQQLAEKLEILAEICDEVMHPEIIADARRIAESRANCGAAIPDPDTDRSGRDVALSEHFDAILNKSELFCLADRYQEMGVPMRMMGAMGIYDRPTLLDIGRKLFAEPNQESTTAPNMLLRSVEITEDFLDFIRNMATFYESILGRLLIIADDICIEKGEQATLMD